MADKDEPEPDRVRNRSPSVAPRVTLQFVGPKLALPGEDSHPDDDAPSSDEFVLRLQSGESPLPTTSPSDSGQIPARAGQIADGWTRLRDSELPVLPHRARTSGAALELVEDRSRPASVRGLNLENEMTDRFALDDFTGALRCAELLLGQDPAHGTASRVAASCRERLLQFYTARLAALSQTTSEKLGAQVPRVIVAEPEMKWMGLEPRQAFLLSRIDGSTTIDELLDIILGTRMEGLKTILELVELGALRVGA